MRRAFGQTKEADGHNAKYRVGLDPLEKEAKLKDIKPLSKDQTTRMAAIANELLKQGGLHDDEKEALRAWKMHLVTDDIEGTVSEEFLRDFWGWIQGKGTEADHNNTPWGRQSLADDPQVCAYIDMFVSKMHDYKLKLELMKTKRPIGMNQVFLYFKYIVRGKKVGDGFLSDWQQFLDEFDEARALGQKYRDDEENFLAHETAPYGKKRQEFAARRENDEALASKMLKGFSGKHVPRGAAYSDDEDEDSKGKSEEEDVRAPEPEDVVGGLETDESSTAEELHDLAEDIAEALEERKGEVEKRDRDRNERNDRKAAKPAKEPKQSKIVYEGEFESIEAQEAKGLRAQLAAEGENVKKARAQVDELDAKFKAREAELDQAVKSAKEEAGKSDAKEEELQKKLQALEAAKVELMAERAKTQKELEAMEKSLKAKTSLAESLQAEQKKVNDLFEKAKNGDEKARGEVLSSIRVNIDDIVSSIEQNHVKDIRQLKDELATFAAQNSELKQKLDSVPDKYEMTTAEISEIRAKVWATFAEELEKNSMDASTAARNLQNRMAELQSSVTKHVEEQEEALIADFKAATEAAEKTGLLKKSQREKLDDDLQPAIKDWRNGYAKLSPFEDPAETLRVIGSLQSLRDGAFRSIEAAMWANRVEKAAAVNGSTPAEQLRQQAEQFRREFEQFRHQQEARFNHILVKKLQQQAAQIEQHFAGELGIAAKRTAVADAAAARARHTAEHATRESRRMETLLAETEQRYRHQKAEFDRKFEDFVRAQKIAEEKLKDKLKRAEEDAATAGRTAMEMDEDTIDERAEIDAALKEAKDAKERVAILERELAEHRQRADIAEDGNFQKQRDELAELIDANQRKHVISMERYVLLRKKLAERVTKSKRGSAKARKDISGRAFKEHKPDPSEAEVDEAGRSFSFGVAAKARSEDRAKKAEETRIALKAVKRARWAEWNRGKGFQANKV